MKMNIYISNPDLFLKDQFDYCFEVRECDYTYAPNEWILAGEVDIEIDVDRQTVVNSVLATIEETEQKERAEHQVKMDLLEKRKQELLSIEYKG